MNGWRSMATAPTEGPKVLAACRHTKAVHHVWPSELNDQASNGTLYYKAWMPVIHPDDLSSVDAFPLGILWP